MKILRGKSIFGLMYALLLAIPMVSVISKVIYVQSNKNAYLNYSGNNIDNEIYELKHINNVAVGDYVYYTNLNQTQIQRSGNDLVIQAHNITLNNVTYNNADSVQFYAYPASPNSNTLYCVIKEGSTTLISRNVMESSYYLTFYFEGYNSNNVNQDYVTYIDFYKISYNSFASLDNVFDYAIDETIKDNNYGKIDFLSWFNNMFLDNNTDVNNRYTRYVNWYLNYTMFISCSYLLFLVLMWFINFARKLLDRGMNYDW